MRTIESVLHPSQRDVFSRLARFNVLEIGRRWGKTFFGIQLAAEDAMNGRPHGWFAPSYKYLADPMRERRWGRRRIAAPLRGSLGGAPGTGPPSVLAGALGAASFCGAGDRAPGSARRTVSESLRRWRWPQGKGAGVSPCGAGRTALRPAPLPLPPGSGPADPPSRAIGPPENPARRGSPLKDKTGTCCQAAGDLSRGLQRPP